MRLLFIKLKHIGDSLLLTPTLTAARARYPAAEIWVVVRRGCEGIMAGCLAVDRLLTSAAPEPENRTRLAWLEDVQLVRQLRCKRFDYAFELSDGDRGRWLCRLSGAKIRCVNNMGRPLNWWWRRQFNRFSLFNWMECHRVEKDFFTVNDCLPLDGPPPPLTFDRGRVEPWKNAPVGDYAVMHPGTRWWRKQWPEAKWVEGGHGLLQRFVRLVISVGPSPEETRLAARLTGLLGPRAVNTEGKLSWAQLAGVLYGAKLFVGPDTAAMHLAAACQTPIVALFGPSTESQWKPWKVKHRLVQVDHSQRGPTAPGVRPEELLKHVSVRQMLDACDELLLDCSREAEGCSPRKPDLTRSHADHTDHS